MPFHTALRLAIADRGLALNRLSDRLAERGVRLSVSTLSNWQRGVSRPERTESLRALSTLEEVLSLEAGSLAGLVPRGRRRELGPGTSRQCADRLRAELDARNQGELTVLSIQDDIVVGLPADTWEAQHRIVARAEENGVARRVILFHAHGSPLPDVQAGAGCDLGRVVCDEDAGLIAAEIQFPALAHGETYPILFSLRGRRHSTYHGRWIRTGHRYELTVAFQAGIKVQAAHRIWRMETLSPHKDVAELRLIGGALAHLVDPEASPGFHGIRWE
jgi:hypothetical protein